MDITQFLSPYLESSILFDTMNLPLTPFIRFSLQFGRSSLLSLNLLPLSLKYWCFPGVYAYSFLLLLVPSVGVISCTFMTFYSSVLRFSSLCHISCLSSRTVYSVMFWTSPQIAQQCPSVSWISHLSPLHPPLLAPPPHKPAISPDLVGGTVVHPISQIWNLGKSPIWLPPLSTSNRYIWAEDWMVRGQPCDLGENLGQRWDFILIVPCSSFHALTKLSQICLIPLCSDVERIIYTGKHSNRTNKTWHKTVFTDNIFKPKTMRLSLKNESWTYFSSKFLFVLALSYLGRVVGEMGVWGGGHRTSLT